MRLVLVLAFVTVLSACQSTGDSTPTAAPTAYECPEYPVWHRNLDLVEDEGHPSPRAAVRDAAGDEVEVGDVRRTGRSSEVDVRLAGEDGVFFVDRVASGWLVEGGEGCAVMPASDKVLGPDEECAGGDPTPPSDLEEGDEWIYGCMLGE
ncbi:hypothetical protein [Nocardioides sp. 503]|uniref:hypothetical protein n=1 Tax=Nocardioides sp. 503 TaxID=2508326 RepID=UPI0010705C43|nr:hypothetical protein [Nocardioides sp. 503]